MRLQSRSLLGLALAFAAPASAQDRVGDVGSWVLRFADATSEPTAVASTCSPQLQAAVSRQHDSASARAALSRVRPCAERIKAAYSRAMAKLEALGPLPAGVGSTGFASDRFLAEQRRLAAESIAHVASIERLLEAIIANNRSALPKLANDVRRGGAALIDSHILMFRLQKEVSQFQSSRQMADVRILVAEAGKALTISAQSPGGIAAGRRLSELAEQARKLRPNLLSAWTIDKARLDALRGSGGSADADRVIGHLEPMISGVASDADRLADVLAKGGTKPVLSLPEATRVASELQSIDFQLQTRAKTFGSSLASGR